MMGRALTQALTAFLEDYRQRHRHPANAILHLVGVPMSFAGLYQLVFGPHVSGIGFLAGGYLLQFLGHRAQGNEVGEVTLIKNLWCRMRSSRHE